MLDSAAVSTRSRSKDTKLTHGGLQLIKRALTNLIDNAMRHAKGAAPVHVSLQRAGAAAQIMIEDHGPGLPDDLVHRLENGQSLRESPRKQTGGGIGGLGLAIAQRAAMLHGATCARCRRRKAARGHACRCHWQFVGWRA